MTWTNSIIGPGQLSKCMYFKNKLIFWTLPRQWTQEFNPKNQLFGKEFTPIISDLYYFWVIASISFHLLTVRFLWHNAQKCSRSFKLLRSFFSILTLLMVAIIKKIVTTTIPNSPNPGSPHTSTTITTWCNGSDLWRSTHYTNNSRRCINNIKRG